VIQILQLLAFVPLALAARVRRLERRTIDRVTDAGANTVERSVTLEPAGKLGDFAQRRLKRSGVLIPAGNDRYYFDAKAYATFRARRRQRALVVVAALVVGIAILYLRGDSS
jgi:hypothetical protein